MKALTALLALIGAVSAAASATPLLAAVPDLWAYNDACEQALRDADYLRADYRCQAAADLAARIRPGTPEQASALDHLAQLRADQGRFEEAIRLAEQASTITESSFGPLDPMLVPVLLRQALIEQICGDTAHAELLLLRAQGILDLSAEPDDLEIAETQQRLGLLYYDLHRFDEAQQAFSQVHSRLERYYGAGNVPETLLPSLLQRARAAAARPDAIAPQSCH
ncbi:MAG: Pilus assembly protein PilF [Hydrocarboniphaga sp.]|uniref:tetratricopeptide repeat protein n=1 Tax=Hydrocarboniphaga sp. TaxID=2033016 RepID=UPI0026376B19|nr:tetratricopeptide repeat protein [Hydrocarboniphaga sp.]MDB5971208.1 Pilus assembly protein PilF [Hydrocarboniphaga sp.]